MIHGNPASQPFPPFSLPPHSLRFPVHDASEVAGARRAASEAASRLGFDAAGAGTAALVVSELARNLVLHARGGEILLCGGRRAASAGGPEAGVLDILAVDKGPGMSDVARSMTDGHSTAGTAGIGLGAVRRQAHVFDLHSIPGAGTVVLARLYSKAPVAVQKDVFDYGVVCVPKPGESTCGDAFDALADEGGGRELIIVADGLGHGPDAARAAQEAVRVFRANTRLPPRRILDLAHQALRPTRGAAVAIAEIQRHRQIVRFTGGGNVAGTILSPDGRRLRSMVSENGTVGHQLRKVTEFVYEYPPGARLLLHSDGLASHWNLEGLPGLAARHPAVVAAALYRDHARGRDDVTILVARHAPFL